MLLLYIEGLLYRERDRTIVAGVTMYVYICYLYIEKQRSGVNMNSYVVKMKSYKIRDIFSGGYHNY